MLRSLSQISNIQVKRPMNHKRCLVCKKAHDTLYWHRDGLKAQDGEGLIWCFCNSCDKWYTLYDYANITGLSIREIMEASKTFSFHEAPDNEVNAMEWPRSFLNLFDPSASLGVDYIKSRGLSPMADMYYDSNRKGIVLPYYLENTFVGAQIRFIQPKLMEDGKEFKITTLPGTRLGYVFWGWSQNPFPSTVKYIIVTEGAFNAASIQQALNSKYGNILTNPYRCIALSGSGVSNYQSDKLKELIASDIKVIASPDPDDAGFKMLDKLRERDACTHYSLIDQDKTDWNDKLKELGHTGLMNLFLRNLRKV